MTLSRIFEGRVICCIGTGPSLRLQQVEVARKKGLVLFGCNRIWEDVPDLAVLWGTNAAFWDFYWDDALAAYPALKWTVSREAATRYGINWTAEKSAPGLSSDPSVIHHGHGSGYSMLNLAFLMGARRVVLLGYDLKYAPDYDGQSRQIGGEPRHYFGEYPGPLQHWPSKQVRNGVHVELVSLYESVAKQGLLEIVNCSPGSVLTCFPCMDIDDVP